MKRVIFVTCLCLVTMIAGCTPPANSPPGPDTQAISATATPIGSSWPRQFEDDLGRTVDLDSPPAAIVTLGPSLLESLFAIGAGDLVVGRDETSTYPEEALAITDIGSLFGELPIEAIVALEPDLILVPEIISEEQIQPLVELNLPVYWQANPLDFDGLYQNLLTLGEITDHGKQAEVLVASLSARQAAVTQSLSARDSRPRVFYELDATDPQSPWTAGRGTFIDTVISMAGGENVGSVLEGEYAQISSEEVLVQDPEIIILSDAMYGVTPESVGERSGWDSLTAVREGRVYPFDPFLLSVPGPRLLDGFEQIAALIHPELVPK